VVFVQIAGPAFTDAPEHKLQRQTHELVGRINGRFGTLSRVAVHYLYALLLSFSVVFLCCDGVLIRVAVRLSRAGTSSPRLRKWYSCPFILVVHG
jgi:trehalose-6-phosphate synthase